MVNTAEVLDANGGGANGGVAQGSDDASQMFSNKRIKNNESQGQAGFVQSSGSQNRGRAYKNVPEANTYHCQNESFEHSYEPFVAATTEDSEPAQEQPSVEAKIAVLNKDVLAYWLWHKRLGHFSSEVKSAQDVFESEPVPVVPNYQAPFDAGHSHEQIMPTQVRNGLRDSTPATSSADPITSDSTAGSGSFATMTDSLLCDHEEGLTAGGIVSDEAEVPAIEVAVETTDDADVHDDEAIEEGGTIDAEIPAVDVVVGAAYTTAEEISSTDPTAGSGSSLVRNTHTMLTRILISQSIDAISLLSVKFCSPEVFQHGIRATAVVLIGVLLS
ncbi:hypothetical protein V6N11_018891 [Hibiscus sabdariffa]|uniref:GAG-pre-integrase domain-containing protein n=1 Tax=Hibiscus sabdariffa TaxID=183260 RepID=A0ABR2R0S8_9ROSI